MKKHIAIFNLIFLLGLAQQTGQEQYFISDPVDVDSRCFFNSSSLVAFASTFIWTFVPPKILTSKYGVSNLNFYKASNNITEFYGWKEPACYKICRQPYSDTSRHAFSEIQNTIWVSDKKYPPTRTGCLRVHYFATLTNCISQSSRILMKTMGHHCIVPIFVRGPPEENPLLIKGDY